MHTDVFTIEFGCQNVKTSHGEAVDEQHIQNLFLSETPPSPPKFNVNAAWALAPMGERNQTLNITFANERAETLRFGGAGVQHSVCCRLQGLNLLSIYCIYHIA